MPPESLERLIGRLEQAAATLRTGELPAEQAAALVEECARVAAEAGAEPHPGGPAGGAPAGRPARAGWTPLSYPDHLREDMESYLAALKFSAEPATDGLEEAMRYSLL